MNRFIPYRSERNFTSEIHINDDVVTKNIILEKLPNINKRKLPYLRRSLFDREVYWLEQLGEASKHFPLLLESNASKLSIQMSYAGEPVTDKNRPNDYYQQMFRITQILLQHRCYYNDWKPENILVLDGVVSLIDFGWTPIIIPDYSLKGNNFGAISEKPGGELFMVQ